VQIVLFSQNLFFNIEKRLHFRLIILIILLFSLFSNFSAGLLDRKWLTKFNLNVWWNYLAMTRALKNWLVKGQGKVDLKNQRLVKEKNAGREIVDSAC
jgi:hypothetical protein